MTTPKRFTNGVTNVKSDKTLGQYLAMDPTKMHVYFDDFDTYAAGDFIVTETSAGATEALADGDGGRLLLTNSAGDNDVLGMQLAKEGFTFEAGKKAWFKAKFQISEATQMDAVVGIHVTETAPVASPPNGIFFRKDDGDTNWDFAIRAGSANISETAAIATAGAATDITLGYYFDGVNTFEYFVNDVSVGTAETTSFPTEALNVSFMIQAGSSDARTANFDYVLAAKER